MPRVVLTDIDGNDLGTLELVNQTVQGTTEEARKFIDDIRPVDPDNPDRELFPEDGADYLIAMLLTISRSSYVNARLE